MTKNIKHSNLDETILTDVTVDPNARGRRSDLFHKRFRQSFKDHRRYGKADRALNKNCHKENQSDW